MSEESHTEMVWDFLFLCVASEPAQPERRLGQPFLYCHNITIFSRFPNFSFIQNKFGFVGFFAYLCRKDCNMEEQVSIVITADTCFAPDFLRQLANEIEEREGEGNFSFKTENGIADIFY